MERILINFDKILPMKNVLMLALIIAGSVSVSFGQAAKKGLQTVTISTPTVQCGMCKQRIEKYMIREDGVTKVNVDYKHKKTKVTYYAERTNVENIKTAIANVGYDADDVTANEDSYKELPKCCKKPEDGGGMDKK
jgi:periplasmic mercuric ion binding protein